MASRILITGSRTWSDRDFIFTEIHNALTELNAWDDFVIVHGSCPSGADRHASEIAQSEFWDEEPHPAMWEELGRAAGFIRNIEMVKAGADICLAFIRAGSRGASHCAEQAELAGIKTRRFEIG